MTIQQNVSLMPYNTLAVDAKAAHFAIIQQFTDLEKILNDDQWRETPLYILGGGSNVLFTEDFPGLILKNELLGREILEENDQAIRLKIASGENWHELVEYCVTHHYGGIENLSLIPGTVGAAPMQNIGAYGIEIESVFESLEALDLATGIIKTFTHEECQFGYRNSIFKQEAKGKYFITSVTLKLTKQPIFNTQYGAIEETLKALNLTPSIESISQAVIQIRKSKLPNPKEIPNAGSFFKNPLISGEQFKALKTHYPDIPHYPAENQKIKIPAAWLIEQCGWKGKQVGNVGVHQHQALVLINPNHGSGDELKKLAQTIQASVLNRFGVALDAEVNII